MRTIITVKDCWNHDKFQCGIMNFLAISHKVKEDRGHGRKLSRMKKEQSMIRKWLIGFVAAVVAGTLHAAGSKAPYEAYVYFISPSNGASLSGHIKVKFGLQGMTVAPAGVETKNSGHHHLLINTTLRDMSVPIPSDRQHIHFSHGQTETVLKLAPGEYTLQLVFSDYLHIPHFPPLISEKITIHVK
jgi:hypothetical protein